MEIPLPITVLDPNASECLLHPEQNESESSQDSQPLVTRNYIQSLPFEILDHIFAFCYWDGTFDPLSEYLDVLGTAELPELDSSGEDSDDEPEPNHTLNSATYHARQARHSEPMKSIETLQMEPSLKWGRSIWSYALPIRIGGSMPRLEIHPPKMPILLDSRCPQCRLWIPDAIGRCRGDLPNYCTQTPWGVDRPLRHAAWRWRSRVGKRTGEGIHWFPGSESSTLPENLHRCPLAWLDA